MRKLLFVFLTLLTWYLAAMYRADVLMISAVFEMIIFFSMPVCVRYLKKKTKMDFWQSHMVVSRAEHVECPFQVVNQGWLPVSRFRIRISYIYEGDEDRKYAAFSGNIAPKKTDRVQIRVPAPWNGKMSVRVENMNVYDYFSLFHAKLACGQEMTIILLPPDRSMSVSAGEQKALPEMPAEFQQSEMQKRNHAEEFLQLREYTQGDPYRYIHWKQSARTGILWIKEYQEADKKSVSIYLDFSHADTKSIEEISAFYEKLWSLTVGFLGQDFLVNLRWRNEAGIGISRAVADHTSAAAVFGELYEMDWSEEKQSIKEEHDGNELEIVL